ncbi:MAG: tetratricopeptide repeat protein [Candidatus Cryosericum sp.]|nr:tetratricopeptide repeat protein [bacterium]
MVDKNSTPIGNSAEERNDRRQRERLAELTRLFKKDPAAFVQKVEQACPPGTKPATGLLDAAVVLAEQDEFKPALALLDRAAELYELEHDNAGLAHVYVNMGPLYGMLDQLEKGIEFSLKAEGLAKSLPADHEFTLHYASDLGGMYTEMEAWDKAMHYFQIACETANRMGNSEVEGDALLIMSQVAIAQGDAAKARELAEKGEIIGKRLKDTLFQARALQTMGDASALDGEYQQAIALFQQALDLEADQPSIELRQQLFWEMSESYEEIGKSELAEDYRSRAADLGETDEETDE